MNDVLAKYLPEHAVLAVFNLIVENNVHLKIVNERHTRHGDYRKAVDGKHQITVNSSLNKYRFMITLIHEIAHLVAFEKHGRMIKPHGLEWKQEFRLLMLPFLRPEIFPNQLLPLLARHFRNPSASSDTDASLALALKSFDEKDGQLFLFELPYGSLFRIRQNRIFQKGALRVKRYECVETATGRTFLFNPNAEVEPLPQKVNRGEHI
ncbi:SprT-like domain-containing protein [Flavobacterium silvaticum]|uniref:SprT domain-containing protein n=1 Tax=Flavobacterium silvaticum TaxID=1852020 RepID=A0A972FQS3_9FLAO|nr:SprT-like domain-containing protein [Flavobacterium silvaticum]NMH29650.1 sprT domain-containing protein [Flavobacterium silvaticum]